MGKASARGFSLIEALVSLVVLSIGLLGVAGLQLASLRSNQGAALRSQATFLAYDIIDRMRANRGAALAGAYDIALGASPVAGTVAGNDLTQWKQEIGSTLPAGAITPDGAIQLDPATQVVTVTLQWDDSHGSPSLPGAAAGANPGAPEPVTFTTSTQLVN